MTKPKNVQEIDIREIPNICKTCEHPHLLLTEEEKDNVRKRLKGLGMKIPKELDAPPISHPEKRKGA